MLAATRWGAGTGLEACPLSPPAQQDPTSLPSPWPKWAEGYRFVLEKLWSQNLHPQALLADEEREAQRDPAACLWSHSEEGHRPEQGARLMYLPGLSGDHLGGQTLPGGWGGPAGCRCPSHWGASVGPLPAPWGIFSGCFRSSKFTQILHMSCHKKSLWPRARARSGGGGTCEPGVGVGPLSAPPAPPQISGCATRQRWEKRARKVLWGQKTLLLDVPPAFKAAFPLLVKDSLGDPENPTPLRASVSPAVKGRVESP